MFWAFRKPEAREFHSVFMSKASLRSWFLSRSSPTSWLGVAAVAFPGPDGLRIARGRHHACSRVHSCQSVDVGREERCGESALLFDPRRTLIAAFHPRCFVAGTGDSFHPAQHRRLQTGSEARGNVSSASTLPASSGSYRQRLEPVSFPVQANAKGAGDRHRPAARSPPFEDAFASLNTLFSGRTAEWRC